MIHIHIPIRDRRICAGNRWLQLDVGPFCSWNSTRDRLCFVSLARMPSHEWQGFGYLAGAFGLGVGAGNLYSTGPGSDALVQRGFVPASLCLGANAARRPLQPLSRAELPRPADLSYPG